MASKKCPACGRDAEGRFCSWCGASLGGVRCASCGAEAEPGARFCNACGAPLGGVGGGVGGGPGGEPGTAAGGARAAAGRGAGSRAVWWVAGGLMVVIILAVALPVVRGGSDGGREAGASGAAPPTAGPSGQQGMTDLSSMTPRQAADQLYTRIMTTAETGDSASVAFFLPMGIQAYERARPLDADGLFHLSLLQRMAGDAGTALATAREALAVHPDHLLVLAAAAGAAAETGDSAAAAEYYRSFLDSYQDERAKGLEEYELHSGMMPELLREARAFTGDGGGAP